MVASTRKRKRVPGRCVWDPSLLQDSFDKLGVNPQHLAKIWIYLAKHPETDCWAEVDWTCKALRGIPLVARKELANFSILSSRVEQIHESSDGATTKLAVELHDGFKVETVLMRHEGRTSVCVSSQVGCAMRCSFCATGTMGILGDLNAGEIVEQLVHASRAAGGANTVRNVVFMGMGEPFNNYDAVLAAVRMMTDLRVFALRRNRVTVSTVGIVPRIRSFAADAPGVSLALSLHAPTQSEREAIMPAARTYPLTEVLAALDEHLSRAKRATPSSVACMIEYIMLRQCGDVNDSVADARVLGALLHSRRNDIMVNLIPYNPTDATPEYQRATAERTHNFKVCLRHEFQILTCVRHTMGDDIAGACGQLVQQGSRAPTDIEDLGRHPAKAPRAQPKRKNSNGGSGGRGGASADAGMAAPPPRITHAASSRACGSLAEAGLLALATATALSAVIIGVAPYIG